MAEASLVEEDINAGSELLQALDAANLKIRAAFWYLESERDEYRLYLGSPVVDVEGPRVAYEQVQRVLRNMPQPPPIQLDRINVVSPTSELPALLRTAIRTGPGIDHIRFRENTVRGTFIEDAFIYRST